MCLVEEGRKGSFAAESADPGNFLYVNEIDIGDVYDGRNHGLFFERGTDCDDRRSTAA